MIPCLHLDSYQQALKVCILRDLEFFENKFCKPHHALEPVGLVGWSLAVRRVDVMLACLRCAAFVSQPRSDLRLILESARAIPGLVPVAVALLMLPRTRSWSPAYITEPSSLITLSCSRASRKPYALPRVL